MKKEFLWGGALSNVHAEGGYLEDGKGLNVYDTLVVTPEPGIKPMFCTTDVATDHYHLLNNHLQLERYLKRLPIKILFSYNSPYFVVIIIII